MTTLAGTSGRRVDHRFIVPRGMDENDLCLFSIIDLEELYSRGESDIYWRAQGFGVSWGENSTRFSEIFSYKVATISEMEEIEEKEGRNEVGFYYICYRTFLRCGSTGFLSGNGPENPSELLGWRRHRSNYLPRAKREAMAVTYHIARRFGEDIGKRIGRNLEIIMPEEEIIQGIEEIGGAESIALNVFS